MPLDQAFDGGSLYVLRAAVAAHAAAAGLSQSRVYEVVTAAHELAANAVRHGAGHGRLRLWTDATFLYCQVSDDGPANDGPANDGPANDGRQQHTANSTASSTQLWPAHHGHGLWVISQVASQFSLSHGPGGTIATARFTIGPHQ